MGTVHFITHPEVVVDPAIPVRQWTLSPRGIERMREFASTEAMAGVRYVWASSETKAIEAAGILARRLALTVAVHPGLDENDRSATGFLPPEEFEQVADAFFSRPEESVRGWEKAVDAQERVAFAVDEIIGQSSGGGDMAIVAHGGVGTLLLCRLLGVPISRSRDQPFQGNFWSFDARTRRVLRQWTPIAPV